MHNVNHAMFAVLLLLMRTLGLPVQPNAVVVRKVYNPHITAPPTDAVFATGASTTVTWDATGIPADLSYNGTLLLGFTTREDGSEEHLDVDNPLATDVDLRAGSKRITFPEHLPTRTSYIIVLLGDSGNKSPMFTITAHTQGVPTIP